MKAFNLPARLQEIVDVYQAGPHWQTMGYELIQIKEGFVSIQFNRDEKFNNINGTVHGGVIAGLLDTTMGMNARTLGDGSPVTIQLTVQYLKPAVDPVLLASSYLVSQSRSVFFMRGEIRNESDELIAFATASFKVA